MSYSIQDCQLINKAVQYLQTYITHIELDDRNRMDYFGPRLMELVAKKNTAKTSMKQYGKELDNLSETLKSIFQNYDYIISTGDRHSVLGFVSYVAKDILSLAEITKYFNDTEQREDIRFNYQLMKDILE
jgi:hypothetical protein